MYKRRRAALPPRADGDEAPSPLQLVRPPLPPARTTSQPLAALWYTSDMIVCLVRGGGVGGSRSLSRATQLCRRRAVIDEAAPSPRRRQSPRRLA